MNTTARLAIFCSSLGLLAACAAPAPLPVTTAPSTQAEGSAAFAHRDVPKGMGRLILYAALNPLTGAMIGMYKLTIDGVETALPENKKSLVLDRPPGKYLLRLSSLGVSQQLDVSVGDSELAFLRLSHIQQSFVGSSLALVPLNQALAEAELSALAGERR